MAERHPLGRAAHGQRIFGFYLMAIAGWCDAVGFLLFAQLYVSFMSGDATQWLFFVLGALAGTITFGRLGCASFWVPAIASVALLPMAKTLPRMIDHPTIHTV